MQHSINSLWQLWPGVIAGAAVLTCVVGVAILLRNGRRSRRATGLALAALTGMAGDLLFGLAMWATAGWWSSALPQAELVSVMGALSVVRHLWWTGSLLLIVWAVVADRQPTPPSGPEADDRDPPACPALAYCGAGADAREGKPMGSMLGKIEELPDVNRLIGFCCASELYVGKVFGSRQRLPPGLDSGVGRLPRPDDE